MTVAEYLIARLKQAGVKHVFAVPGDYASPFLQALDAAQGIERIANRCELGCGYAADGYARFQGAGAACVQWGVGTFSLLNCMAGSFVERVPVAVISASPSATDRELERSKKILFHHSTGNLRADQIVFQNVTVASEIITSAENAPIQIDGAIRAMLTKRRPIYIEILTNVWSLACAPPVGTIMPDRISSDPDSLAAAIDWSWGQIQSAALPVIWAGVEIQRFGLQDALQQLIDLSGLHFTTTSLGKTVLDEAQPRFIGTFAGPASPALTRAVMAATDCPIALGTIITDDYLDIMASSFGKMIEVTDEVVRAGYQYYHQVTLKDFLEGLTERYKAAGGGPHQYSLPTAPAEEISRADPADRLTYNFFFRELTDFLKEENLANEVALVLGESTSLYVFGNVFGLPRNSFVANAAWGSLGHETGCALGVALGSGKRPFVVAGDGGFQMICQEISSLAARRCNAVVFVLSNSVYAIEQAFVDITAFRPGGTFAAFDKLVQWDYLALARAFGAKGYRTETVQDLRTVLRAVKGLEVEPTLVEVVIPEKDLPPQLARLAGMPINLSKYGRSSR